MNSKKKVSAKMILMLTEFSNRDKNATDAALKLAVKLGLNLMLLHVYPVTGNEQSKNQMENAKYLSEIDRHFDSEKKRLQEQLEISHDRIFEPIIKTCSGEGSLSDNVCEMLEKEDIVMIVMGDALPGKMTTCSAQKLTKYFIKHIARCSSFPKRWAWKFNCRFFDNFMIYLMTIIEGNLSLNLTTSCR